MIGTHRVPPRTLVPVVLAPLLSVAFAIDEVVPETVITNTMRRRLALGVTARREPGQVLLVQRERAGRPHRVRRHSRRNTGLLVLLNPGRPTPPFLRVPPEGGTRAWSRHHRGTIAFTPAATA